MAFRFSIDDATVQAGLRRIGHEQIEEALAWIGADALPPNKIVHEVRRNCKALRGLIRIVRPAFPRYAPENLAFREIGHLLAGMRDARVLGDVLDIIVASAPEAFDAASVERIRAGLTPRSEARPMEDVLDQCARLLRAAQDRVMLWTLNADGWDALSGGVTDTYRQARRAMTQLAREDKAALSHEWRKHVKYHASHMRLLRDIAPAMHKREKKLDKLAVLLGDRHDYDMLAGSWHVRPWRNEEWPTIQQLTSEAQRRAAALGAKARKRGEGLFDDKPRKIADRWGKRWDNRRETEPA